MTQSKPDDWFLSVDEKGDRESHITREEKE